MQRPLDVKVLGAERIEVHDQRYHAVAGHLGGWEPHSIVVNCAKGYVFQPDCRTRGVHAGQAGEPMT